ncbi:unnamed protein product, partial [Vitis vinifera]
MISVRCTINTLNHHLLSLSKLPFLSLQRNSNQRGEKRRPQKASLPRQRIWRIYFGSLATVENRSSGVRKWGLEIKGVRFWNMVESQRDSDGEVLNSSHSSMSSESCSSLRLSFSRLSFEHSPENLTLKPHRSSDSAYEAIRSAAFSRKSGLSFRDFKLVRRIGSGDIGTVYLCRLRSSSDDDGCFYAMKYCSGGDLHSLKHKQPQKRFSLSSARFYAAEVLVALEYLHMLGIIYRDLKPENVLVRSDGHIMLSDFDLSLCSNAIPASCSFVGTHEYVSPEVASGRSHGNGVDWWALGIFIYEMVYGATPFAGATNEATLRNIVKKPLSFPTETPASVSEMHARDLMSGLLVKDPASRLGSKRGAADVKTHPFFKGLNFALVRSLTPPEIPGLRRHKTPSFRPDSANSNKGRYHHQQQQQQQQQQQSTAFDYF